MLLAARSHYRDVSRGMQRAATRMTDDENAASKAWTAPEIAIAALKRMIV
jgi:hypothetical protein